MDARKLIKVTLISLLVSAEVYAKPTTPTNGQEYIEKGERKTYKSSDASWTKKNVVAYSNPLEYSSLLTDVGLQTAVTAIGATATTMNIDKPYVISNNLAFPANIQLKFFKGGSFAIADTKTVLIGGLIEAPTDYQIFSGLGDISISQKNDIYPQWFGATADGTTDDTNALTKTIETANTNTNTIVFTGGTFIVDPPPYASGATFTVTAGLRLQGTNSGKIKIKDNAGAYQTLFYGNTGVDGFTVDNLEFDGNVANNPVTSATVDTRWTFIIRGNNVRFTNNRFHDESNWNYIVVNGDALHDLEVSGNNFYNTGESVGAVDHDHSSIYTRTLRGVRIVDNNFSAKNNLAVGVNTAIEVHTGDAVIEGNTIRDFLFGINLSAETNAEITRFGVNNNQIDVRSMGVQINAEYYAGHTGTYGLSNAIIANNNIRIRQLSATWSNLCSGIWFQQTNAYPYKNIVISNNLIEFDYESVLKLGDISSRAIGYFNGSGIGIEDVQVTNNTIINAPVSGIRFQAPMKNVKIADNTLINPGHSLDPLMASYLQPIFAYPKGTADYGLWVERNKIIDNQQPSRLITGMYIAADNALLDTPQIIDNTVTLTGATKTSYLYYMLLQTNDNVKPFIKGQSSVGSYGIAKIVRAGSSLLDTTNNKMIIWGAEGTTQINMDYGTAVPIAGTYLKGSIRYNTSPSAGDPAGWICVTAGTPGVWEAFGGQVRNMTYGTTNATIGSSGGELDITIGGNLTWQMQSTGNISSKPILQANYISMTGVSGDATSIHANTSDGTDDKSVLMCGGGSCPSDGTRGGVLKISGNEVATVGGNVDITAGTGVGGRIVLHGMLNKPAPSTPANASDTCTQGDITWDTSYIYVCINANTWKRAGLLTW